MAKTAVRLDHHHFGANPDDKDFDLSAARETHQAIMQRWDDPREGDDYKAMVLKTIQDATAAEIEKHKPAIQRFLNDWFGRRNKLLAKAIVKSYVEVSVSAAASFGKDWSAEQRAKHPHGYHGYFRHTGRFEQPKQPLSYAQQQAGNVAAVQALMAQAATIAAVGGRQQDVEYRIRNKKGDIRTHAPARGKVPKLKRGEAVVGIRGAGVSGDHLTVGDRTFNLLQALGMSAKTAGGLVPAEGESTLYTGAKQFHDDWANYAGTKEYGTDTGRAFKRIESGSKALKTIAQGSPKAQVAAAVGQYVGSYGPEAEKVIGPHARRAAYQYRGVERKPRGLPDRPQGMTPEQYHGLLVGTISRHVPSRQIHELNLASGYTAPSHGYLLDQNGDVVTEAHGYADDHYLPFKLSGLWKMKPAKRGEPGGSYIRTRSTGGPTTEDIYASAISGAKGFTVASRQGTYQLTFDNEFAHDKRFGDIALGMSKRYGKILDAVASGKVKVHGEVTQAQYEQLLKDEHDRLLAAAGDNLEARARVTEQAQKNVEDMVRAQENPKVGRTLFLNGEGYQHALEALKSQYPYYIDSVAYHRPSDPNFRAIGPDKLPVERRGNPGERDTGYVKPRHLKSQDVLVGYFDPLISGFANRPQWLDDERIRNTGEIRGDLAYYQNWPTNPYRRGGLTTTQQAAPGTAGNQAGTATGRTGSVVVGGVRTGLDAEAQQLHNQVVQIVARMQQRGEDMDGPEVTRLRAWRQDPIAFQQYINRHGHPNVRAELKAIAETRGIHNVEVRPDEEPDREAKLMDEIQAIGEYEGTRRFLDENRYKVIRAELANASADMPGGDADNPYSYYNVAAEHEQELLDKAYPKPTATSPGHPQRGSKMQQAKAMLKAEREVAAYEEANDVPTENRWDPFEVETEHLVPEAEQEAVPVIERGDVEAAAADTDEKFWTGIQDSVLRGLRQVQEAHRHDEPSDQDSDEWSMWADQKQMIKDAIGAWDDLNPAAGAEVNAQAEHAARAAQRLYRDHPGMGNYTINLPVAGQPSSATREESARKLFEMMNAMLPENQPKPRETSKRYVVVGKGVGQRYSVSKKENKIVVTVRRAA